MSNLLLSTTNTYNDGENEWVEKHDAVVTKVNTRKEARRTELCHRAKGLGSAPAIRSRLGGRWAASTRLSLSAKSAVWTRTGAQPRTAASSYTARP